MKEKRENKTVYSLSVWDNSLLGGKNPSHYRQASEGVRRSDDDSG